MRCVRAAILYSTVPPDLVRRSDLVQNVNINALMCETCRRGVGGFIYFNQYNARQITFLQIAAVLDNRKTFWVEHLQPCFYV